MISLQAGTSWVWAQGTRRGVELKAQFLRTQPGGFLKRHQVLLWTRNSIPAGRDGARHGATDRRTGSRPDSHEDKAETEL